MRVETRLDESIDWRRGSIRRMRQAAASVPGSAETTSAASPSASRTAKPVGRHSHPCADRALRSGPFHESLHFLLVQFLARRHFGIRVRPASGGYDQAFFRFAGHDCRCVRGATLQHAGLGVESQPAHRRCASVELWQPWQLLARSGRMFFSKDATPSADYARSEIAHGRSHVGRSIGARISRDRPVYATDLPPLPASPITWSMASTEPAVVLL
jgi:hypothetical protein